jgi:calcineurin-like phosphoesterase family protein
MIYFSADHHFNHENVIKLSNRPFNNVEQMNNELIILWNSVVKPEDLVFYLGDFGFGRKESLKEICTKLNGHKILVRGNHDKRHNTSALRFIGFEDTFESIQLGKILLTHKPLIDIEKGILNVHGHIHNAKVSLINNYKTKNHICVSVECTSYKPISIEVIRKKFKTN